MRTLKKLKEQHKKNEIDTLRELLAWQERTLRHQVYVLSSIIVLWLLAMGVIFGPAVHEAFVRHQIEKQALVADLVEGAQG